jgi:hypothetical protein
MELSMSETNTVSPLRQRMIEVCVTDRRLPEFRSDKPSASAAKNVPPKTDNCHVGL